ncbi:Organic cation transporter protein [Armadillidium nasatum]|uniref:Organic cation transporter protein n=1 Tax=Armadillidium nasatum TaxID=96803 RepID=A0A5N5TP33_9CRUS|nr:Organic cation transporter protein [Armadillidium nasatum]
MPESIRWLLSTGNGKEAVKVVKQIEKMNNLYIPSHVYDALDPDEGGAVTVGGAEGKERETTEDKPKRKVFDLLRYPNTRKRTINLMFCWAVVTTSYYGLSANSAKIGSNVFTSFILIMLIEVPSYIFAFLVLDRIGRKGTLCFTLLLGGISLIISGFIPSDMHTVIVTLSMLGKSGVSAAFAVVYVYSAEIFPTLYRSIGIGSCSMCARIGGILAPFIANLGYGRFAKRVQKKKKTKINLFPLQDKIYRPLPPFVFGALAISSGLLVFLLPETFGSELPQTLETAENFGTYPVVKILYKNKNKNLLLQPKYLRLQEVNSQGRRTMNRINSINLKQMNISIHWRNNYPNIKS